MRQRNVAGCQEEAERPHADARIGEGWART